MASRTLSKAKEVKQDEFYTQLTDIEKELKHYKEFFRGKIVLCNCDDPRVSNFFRYFALNFEVLGLKRLITTCYKNTDIDLFSSQDKEQAVYLIYEGDKNKNGKIDLNEIEVLPLKGDGDFRSKECIELLKQADIVVTNPPFSLFRAYITLLSEYGKDFLIIGSQNNITYQETFQLFMKNKLWLGYNSGDMAFKVPENYEAHDTRFWIDENGQKWRSLGNICWYTNLETKKRHEKLILYKNFNAHDYPKYVNYDAIEVNRIDNIPTDYDGAMGVPITFMDKYNPDQFEILGIDGGDMGVSYGVGAKLNKEECTKLFKEHKGFRRGKLCFRDENGKLHVCFRRILIRKKQ